MGLTEQAKRAEREHNITIVDSNTCQVKCDVCGQTWQPLTQAGDRFPRRWWQCPNGCNKK